jgi:hypothetical protein
VSTLRLLSWSKCEEWKRKETEPTCLQAHQEYVCKNYNGTETDAEAIDDSRIRRLCIWQMRSQAEGFDQQRKECDYIGEHRGAVSQRQLSGQSTTVELWSECFA